MQFDDPIHLMAYRLVPLEWSFTVNGGYWYPEVIDHYLGVRFEDEDDCMHYGWIRCDVFEGGKILVIKDYAYETKCDIGIAAGDTIGDTTILPIDVININTLPATVYSYNKNIYILIPDFEQLNLNCNVIIRNLSGQIVYSGNIVKEYSIIELDALHEGVYFVELSAKDQTYIGEVFLK